MTTRTKVIAVAVGWALLVLWAFIDADHAGADDHGIVVTCQSVAVWDVYNLGDVTVTRTAGTDQHRPGNALTVPYVTGNGPVLRVQTAHHMYAISAPAGCTTTSTTTTSTSTTTTAPPSSTVPPSTTTALPPAVPPTTVVPSSTSSTVPGSTAPPPPDPGTPSLPVAPPAVPVVETPRYTG